MCTLSWPKIPVWAVRDTKSLLHKNVVLCYDTGRAARLIDGSSRVRLNIILYCTQVLVMVGVYLARFYGIITSISSIHGCL